MGFKIMLQWFPEYYNGETGYWYHKHDHFLIITFFLLNQEKMEKFVEKRVNQAESALFYTLFAVEQARKQEHEKKRKNTGNCKRK